MSITEALSFAALTDVGKKREHNEDNFLVDRKLALFIVCDGMGGHAAGEVASAMAVRTVHEEIKREKELLNDYVANKTGVDRVNKRDITNMLEFAVNRASSKIHAEATQDASKRGMGTTLVAVIFLGTQAFVVHVGDSRMYMMRGGVLEQITEDHNVYNELLKRKKMTRAQVEKLAPKNAITRAVGVYEHCEPDTLVLDAAVGDRFLLCSDGLSEYFEPPLGQLEELVVLLNETDADKTTKSLIDTANERGGKDNITALLVTVGNVSARDEKVVQRLQLKRDMLARMPLFRPLNDREIRRVLQVTEVHAYKNDDLVITEGEKGDELFIVLSGQVMVSRSGAHVAVLKPGEHFGEMSLIRTQPRSAPEVSSGEAELMVIRRTEFFEILRKEHQLAVKLLWQFTGVLADRLAETTADLGDARDELAAEDLTVDIFAEEEGDRMTAKLPAPPSTDR